MVLVESESFSIAREFLEQISFAELPTHSHDCPHCGFKVRYPVMARAHDIEDFQKLMKVAQGVLERHGYTEKLIAEIQAACHIEIAKRKVNKD